MLWTLLPPHPLSPVRAPSISLVFTDLDNTLYDWVAWYSRALYRLLDRAAARSGIPKARLLAEMQQLYRHRHGLEEPEALLHAPSIVRRFGDPIRAREALAQTFASYYHARHATGLRSYPGVRSTLQRLAAAGVMVVGHTEAPANHAVARLRALGLEHALVSLLAAPPAPNDPTVGDADFDELPFPVRCLDPEERKPNPAVLHQLCDRFGIPTRRALYVGDSLGRDVRMAHDAGMWTAWARYGTRHDPRDWARVVEVSPWTASQRAQAQVLTPRDGARPDVILHDSFEELLDHFHFGAQQPVASSSLELVAQ